MSQDCDNILCSSKATKHGNGKLAVHIKAVELYILQAWLNL